MPPEFDAGISNIQMSSLAQSARELASKGHVFVYHVVVTGVTSE
jgi:hypothetical protein